MFTKVVSVMAASLLTNTFFVRWGVYAYESFTLVLNVTEHVVDHLNTTTYEA